MTVKQRRIKEEIDISKSGIPCMWEKGGGMSSIDTLPHNDSVGPKDYICQEKGELSGEHAYPSCDWRLRRRRHQRCDTR